MVYGFDSRHGRARAQPLASTFRVSTTPACSRRCYVPCQHIERCRSRLHGRMGGVEPSLAGVLQEAPKRVCYIATVQGAQAGLNSTERTVWLPASIRNAVRACPNLR